MKLNEKHRRILELYCGDGVMATREELAKMAGVSRRTVHRVLAEPEAKRIIRELTDERMALSRPAVIAKMERDAIKGDSSARRDYLQVAGDIGSGTNIVNKLIQNTGGREEETFDERLKRQLAERNKALTQDAE
jgi:DNA-binding transcriptional regulator YhcF (GntR family)